MPPLLQDLISATVISHVVGAIVIILIGWIVAKLVSGVIRTVLHRLRLNRRMSPGATEGAPGFDIEGLLATVVYWLILLFAIVAALDLLQLTLIASPLTSFLSLVVLFIPRLFAAIILLVIGWIIANLIRRIVAELLVAAGIDRVGDRVGMNAPGSRLSDLVGLIVFALIFIPILTSALDTLGLGAVSVPLSSMLNRLLLAIPNIIAAAILLWVTYIVGKIVAEIVSGILTGIGFNQLPVRLGLMGSPTAGGTTPSQTVGGIVLGAIMVTAAIEAAQLLGFVLVADLLSHFLVFGARLLMALVIFAVGLYLSGVAYRAVMSSGVSQASVLALITRIGILVITAAMALRETDLANDIVNLAFALMLGAIAVAIALAFGNGGRDFAREELLDWRRSARSTPTPPPPTTGA